MIDCLFITYYYHDLHSVGGLDLNGKIELSPFSQPPITVSGCANVSGGSVSLHVPELPTSPVTYPILNHSGCVNGDFKSISFQGSSNDECLEATTQNTASQLAIILSLRPECLEASSTRDLLPSFHLLFLISSILSATLFGSLNVENRV